MKAFKRFLFLILAIPITVIAFMCYFVLSPIWFVAKGNPANFVMDFFGDFLLSLKGN
jgi:hypothetical protein